MSLSKIEELRYLWDGSQPDWVLVHVNSDRVTEPPRYVVYNIKTRMGMLIEDVAEAEEVERRMLEAGARVITSPSEI